MLIGERTAENIKCTIGTVYPRVSEVEMEVRGRNLLSGLPRVLKMNSAETSEALSEPMLRIIEVIHGVLEKTPPELSADISDRGIVLTGGGSLLYGLDRLIQEKTGINTIIADDAIKCVALGTGAVLDNLQYVQKR